MNRIDRLSAILTMLQSSTSVKPKQITERFGIGIRTVYRDIRALEEGGIPIVGDSRLGYSLIEGYKLPPLMFTQEEAFAFLAAERLVYKFTDSGLQTSYQSGVDKIRAVMRLTEKEILTTIDKKLGQLDFHSPATLDSQNRLQILLDGISKQTKLEMKYTSHSKNESAKRIIDPVGVFFSMANWYLIGYCNTKNDYRTFRVSRIQEVHTTSIPVNMKHPPLDTFLQQLKEQTDLHKVILEVDRNNLSIIDESKYYHGLISEDTKGDKVELQFMVFSLDRMARWYLSYMDIAKIIFPEELKGEVAKIIQKHKC